jgi:hypothetical protein
MGRYRHLDQIGGVDAIEQRGCLLERTVLRLKNVYVAKCSLGDEPTAVYDLYASIQRAKLLFLNERTHVVFPPKLSQGNGVNVLVEDERKGNCEVEDVETFCSQRIR